MNINTPTAGQVLKYGSAGEWENSVLLDGPLIENIKTSMNLGLDNLLDVNFAVQPSQNQILTFHNSIWKSMSVFTGDVIGGVTGDLTGDVCDSGANKILTSGGNGTAATFTGDLTGDVYDLSLIHISEPTRPY